MALLRVLDEAGVGLAAKTDPPRPRQHRESTAAAAAAAAAECSHAGFGGATTGAFRLGVSIDADASCTTDGTA